MSTTDSSLELVWGIDAISKLIGRTVRQTHGMLASGKLPARQVGTRWVAERNKLIAFFMEDAA